MSKTTIALVLILVIAVGVLLFILYSFKQKEIFPSLTQNENTQTSLTDTTLSLSAETQTVSPGQTATIAVLIHTSRADTNIVQFELSYDPQTITINSIAPGSFFTHSTVALQNIDPSDPTAGRITYALRCSSRPKTQCIHGDSSTLAIISLSINPDPETETTNFQFLPKTIIRSYTGEDILKKTQGIQLAITKPLTTFSSSSAVASPAAK